MSVIEVRSPTRVDLAGGTLDLWPLYNFVGKATTVNVAIDIWTTARLEPLPGTTIELKSEDLKLQASFKNLDEAMNDKDPRLDLLKSHLAYWRPEKGFRLETSSQSPVGGGLGGSSSLTISILKVFERFTREEFRDSHARVHVAHNLEAAFLRTPTGTQDYYPADTGGLCILNYDMNGIHQRVLSVEGTPFKDQFLLVYTGKAHHSGLNNFEVLTRAVRKDPVTQKALEDLSRVSEEMAEACLKSDFSSLNDLFRREFDARIRLAPEFSSPEIEKLADVSLKAGALAVKICGAGGGGCVMVWCPPGGREGVSEACQKAGFQVLNAKPVAPLK